LTRRQRPYHEQPSSRGRSAASPCSARFVLHSTPDAWVSWLLAAAHDHGLAIPPGLHPSFGYRDAPYRLPTLRDVLLHFLLEFLDALGLNNEIPHSLTSPKVIPYWKALDQPNAHVQRPRPGTDCLPRNQRLGPRAAATTGSAG